MSPTFKNKPSELLTATTGKKFYHSRSVAVVMVLGMEIGGETFYAVQKRGTKADLDEKGKWCLPCGYLDWDENATEAVLRELWEEMGIDLAQMNSDYPYIVKSSNYLLQPWHVKSDIDENRQNVVLYHGIIFKSHGALPQFEINKAGEENEVAECKWIKRDDIYSYKWAFDHGFTLSFFHSRITEARYEPNKIWFDSHPNENEETLTFLKSE